MLLVEHPGAKFERVFKKKYGARKVLEVRAVRPKLREPKVKCVHYLNLAQSRLVYSVPMF